jgi:hypothetical protein
MGDSPQANRSSIGQYRENGDLQFDQLSGQLENNLALAIQFVQIVNLFVTYPQCQAIGQFYMLPEFVIFRNGQKNPVIFAGGKRARYLSLLPYTRRNDG